MNKVFNENCLLTMDFLDAESVDLTVTSPPYDNLRDYNGYSFDFEAVAQGLFRITKKGGIVVWVVGDKTLDGSESGTSFRQALYFMAIGFKLHDTMIYAKLNYIPQTHKRYEQEFEYMFIFVKGKIKTFNPLKVKSRTGGTKQFLARKGYGFKEGSFRRREEVITVKETKVQGNIFYYPCGTSGKDHPAVFHKQLAEDHILTWSNPGDLVYDPFAGSGTTPVSALKNGRNFIASEISKEYYLGIEKGLAEINDYASL